MIVKTFKFPEGSKQLVMPIGDLHYGVPAFPVNKVMDHIQWGLDKGAVFVGMGDYLDLISRTDASVARQLRPGTRLLLDMIMREQAEKLITLLKETRGKWIGMVEGNHRWDFENGTAVDQLIANGLGTDFLGTAAFVRLISANRPPDHPEADTIMLLHHGTGGARTPGGRVMTVERLIEGFDADLYLMAHDHSAINEPIDRLYTSERGQLIYSRRKVFARTGGWLVGYEGQPPQPNDTPVVDIRGGYVEQKMLRPAALCGMVFAIDIEPVDDTGLYRPKITYTIM